MENLYEYLISKKNKENVSFGFKKENLKTGDIIEIKKFRVTKYMMFFTQEDARPLCPTSGYARAFDRGDAFFIFKGELLWKFADTFDNNLKSDMPDFIVTAVYPGEKPPIVSMSEVTEKLMKNLIKDRTKIDIK